MTPGFAYEFHGSLLLGISPNLDLLVFCNRSNIKFRNENKIFSSSGIHVIRSI